MEYKRVSRRGSSQYDVHLDEVGEEELGATIAQSIVTKGFCVISPGFIDGQVETAQQDAESMRFYQLSTVIADGLLGSEGSAQVADLEAGAKESLVAIDSAITRLGHIVAPHIGGIGIDMTHRSGAVVHRAGEADDDAPPLTEKAVTKWQSQFLRGKIMVVTFLGPRTGFLELQPYDEEDMEMCQVRTVPGMIVLLRSDAMSHKHNVAGESMAVSAFFMKGELQRRVPEGGFLMTPTAKALEEWSGVRLQQLKEADDELAPWDDEIPRIWQQMMNHNYFKGQISGVAGAACHMPGTYDPDVWFRASNAGADYMVEVPFVRWNHEDVYDADPESWKAGKTYCKHISVMEGIELFDNKFFSLSAHESGGLDPHARLVLEVGYASFANAGYKKKQLMNANGGVYVGCTNHEFMYAVGGGVSGNLCMMSGRISFCLGMKGPSLSFTTEAASGLTAVYHAADSVLKKGTTVNNEMALAISASLCLSAVWWPTWCQSGWMSPEGRCMTFNSSASGFARGDGCGSVIIKSKTEMVDGNVVARDDADKFLGTIAGGMMSNSGQSASLSAPNAAAEQEVIAQAVRNAAVSHADVDGIECHGSGAFLADAIEANAAWRAHRSEAVKERLTFGAIKSAMGNQVEAGGICALLKVVFAAQWGHLTPNLHLRQVNPHIDPFEHPVDIVTENVEFPFRSTFQGVKARGLGGSNVYLLAWGQVDPDRCPPPPPEMDRQPYLMYWPAGAGELEDTMKPRRKDGYCIAGSWTAWKNSDKMNPTGDGNYTYTLVLGENRWEKFQIWLDGEPTRALHPGMPKAQQGSPVYGGEDGSGIPMEPPGSPAAPSWILDGRPYGEGEGKNSDEGKAGDKYLIKLEISGKYQMVTWEKLESAPAIEDAGAVVGSTSAYYIAADWNDWILEPMDADASVPGLFVANVKLSLKTTQTAATLVAKRGGEFQIVREKDWDQSFYPAIANAPSDVEVFGPDDEGYGYNWLLNGKNGDEYRIEFQRTFEGDKEVRKVSWMKK